MLAARSSVRPGRAAAFDQPLAVEEPERELLVVARRAHRHRQRGAVDADLERLLDRDLVALAVVLDGADHVRCGCHPDIVSPPDGHVQVLPGNRLIDAVYQRYARKRVHPPARVSDRGRARAPLRARVRGLPRLAATLSAGIRSLERELGVPLVRRGRQFEGLTPEGERVLEWAQRAIADLESLRQEASRLRGGLEGVLRIGAIPTALPRSASITTRFRDRHPRMRVRLTSMTSRQIAYGLDHGEIDAGLTYVDNEPLAHVDTLPLWHERYLLVAPPDGELGAAATASWRAAAGLPLCLLTPDMQHRRIVDAAFAQAGATPTPAVETNSVSTLVAHARAGLPGITAHTWLDTNPLPSDLRAIPLVDPVVEHTIGLVTAAGQRTPVIAELLSLFAPLELADAGAASSGPAQSAAARAGRRAAAA